MAVGDDISFEKRNVEPNIKKRNMHNDIQYIQQKADFLSSTLDKKTVWYRIYSTKRKIDEYDADKTV